MTISRTIFAVLVVVAPGTTHAQDPYGGASLSGIYSTSDDLVDDEVIDSSAIVGRGYAGVRWNPERNTTRLQVSSSYFNYFDRRDRWSNTAEAEQQLRLSETTRLAFEGSAASNISTLEARSADQLAGLARIIIEPGEHRVTLGAGLRRRYYDGSGARGSSPLLEADYRYRFGRYQYVDLDARHESVNSNNDLFDYNRLSFSAFYTHPLARETRLRAGVAHRSWKWDDRLTPSGERQRDRVFVPQARLTHSLTDTADLELDYRYFMRRSNNDGLERNGHRLAATARVQF